MTAFNVVQKFLEINPINCCFFRAILNSREISCKSAWSRKISWFRQEIFFLLINLVPRVPSSWKRTKFRFKNHKIKEIKEQLKEQLSREASINMKKKFFLIRLHSSTLVYTLHSPTFVYTQLHSSNKSSVFLEQINFCMLIQDTKPFSQYLLFIFASVFTFPWTFV